MTATYLKSNNNNYQDEEDDMSLADIISLKISTTPIEEKNNTMWNDWSVQQQHQNEMYQKQIQSSYYQLQYLQQQQMLMMMNNSNNSRRSSTISSITSSSTTSSHSNKHYYYPPQQYYPLSPSSSSSTHSSIKTTTPKRRQSLGKRIKKVFGMTETTSSSSLLPVEIPNDNNKTLDSIKINTNSLKTKKATVAMTNLNNIPDSPHSSISSSSTNNKHYYRHRQHYSSLPSPASSTVSTISIQQKKKKKSLGFNSVIKVHETFSASEYDRRCDTTATCQKLTPVLALKIKEELNHFKLNDMFVHVDSRKNTHFFM